MCTRAQVFCFSSACLRGVFLPLFRVGLSSSFSSSSSSTTTSFTSFAPCVSSLSPEGGGKPGLRERGANHLPRERRCRGPNLGRPPPPRRWGWGWGGSRPAIERAERLWRRRPREASWPPRLPRACPDSPSATPSYPPSRRWLEASAPHPEALQTIPPPPNHRSRRRQRRRQRRQRHRQRHRHCHRRQRPSVPAG